MRQFDSTFILAIADAALATSPARPGRTAARAWRPVAAGRSGPGPRSQFSTTCACGSDAPSGMSSPMAVAPFLVVGEPTPAGMCHASATARKAVFVVDHQPHLVDERFGRSTSAVASQ